MNNNNKRTDLPNFEETKKKISVQEYSAFIILSLFPKYNVLFEGALTAFWLRAFL